MEIENSKLKEQIITLKRALSHEKAARQSAEKLYENRVLEYHQISKNLRDSNHTLELQNRTSAEFVKRSQYLTKIVLQNLKSGVLLENENRFIEITNQVFCDIFGISSKPDKLIGMNCSDSAESFKHLFKEPENFVSRINTLVREKKLCLSEKLEMKCGIILERDFIPIFNSTSFLGYLWNYRDITDIFRMQEMVSASEEKYRGILENMDLGILEVDCEDRIIKVYDKFSQLVGYTKEELLGQYAAELLLPDKLFLPKILEENQNRKSDLKGLYEVPIRRKNGEIIWVLISGAPIKSKSGEVTGSIGIHLDITDRKRANQKLLEAKKIAEEAVMHEKIFLANMSHDIRTPINAINGLAYLLKETEASNEQVDYIDGIIYSSELLVELVSDILDISRIDAGELTLSEQAFCLKSFLSNLLQTFTTLAHKSNLNLELHILGEMPELVKTDPVVLSRILGNLLNNAIKFTPIGEICLKVSLIQAGSKNDIQFIVCDTGIGIPEDKLTTIFENFKQVDASIRHTYGGTGLGLSIVRRLVQILNGTIEVRSKLGEGSCFTVTIPFKTVEKSDISENLELPDAREIRFENLLIVEDNRLNRMYMHGLLSKWGIKSEFAGSAEEFSNKCKQKTYELILMDVELGDGNGFELTKKLRRNKENPNADALILGVSAYAFEFDKQKALECGMNDYLIKPFRPDQLKEKLIRLSSHRSKAAVNPKSDYASRLQQHFESDLDYALQMTEIFLEILPESINELESAMSSEELKRCFHQLKSSFGLMGYDETSKRCSHLENLCNLDSDLKNYMNATQQIIESAKVIMNDLQCFFNYLKSQ